MKPRLASKTIAAAALVFHFLAIHPAVLAQVARSGEHWVGTWATAVVARAPQGSTPQSPSAPPVLNFKNQTLRQIVRTTLGGERVRVVLTNAFGTVPLTVGAAHIALRDEGAAIRQG